MGGMRSPDPGGGPNDTTGMLWAMFAVIAAGLTIAAVATWALQ